MDFAANDYGTAIADRPTMLSRMRDRAWATGRRTVAIARGFQENLSALTRAHFALRESDLLGSRARCFGRVHLENHGTLRIGDDVALGGLPAAVSITTVADGLLGIGDDVIIEYGTSIRAQAVVSVGDRVRLGPYCVISDTSLQLTLDGSNGWPARGIMIGDDVWLGARVTLMPGVRIGDRAVIAAGSVVSTDIDNDALAAGSPATMLRVVQRDQPRGARARPAAANEHTMVD